MSENSNEQFNVTIQPTPNPNALKFITTKTLKNDGHSTYRTPSECGENKMASEIFKIRGIDQLHFFENSITITKFGYEDWDNIEPNIMDTIKYHIDSHDPNYYDPDPEAERRKALTPELQAIEEIFDRTVRPGLQADGGDIHTVSYENKILVIRYQGACGTCPSSSTGTLYAIKSILQDEYDPEIDVYIMPEETPQFY